MDKRGTGIITVVVLIITVIVILFIVFIIAASLCQIPGFPCIQ